MSVALYSASGNNAILQGTSVGGTKPLHRFIKGQPKIIGVIVLILGSSFFIPCISLLFLTHVFRIMWGIIPSGIVLGSLFITCGILFILTQHNPTKKTVTMSLALSIMTVLGICWTTLNILPDIIHSHLYRHYEDLEENTTESV
ncbi:uncharacterized protein LKV04_012326 [Tautogolabrus adspersus]